MTDDLHPAPTAKLHWKQCAKCPTTYPSYTKGLSPCCDALLIDVEIDMPDHSAPVGAEKEGKYDNQANHRIALRVY